MKVESTSADGKFTIKSGEKSILAFEYADDLPLHSHDYLNAIDIHIKQKNQWQSKFTILKHGIDHGDISLSWKGYVVIRLGNEDNIQQQYILKPIGFWKTRFELLDKKENKILSIQPNFKRKKMSYKYERKAEHKEESEKRLELLIYAGFGANLYRNIMMAG